MSSEGSEIVDVKSKGISTTTIILIVIGVCLFICSVGAVLYWINTEKTPTQEEINAKADKDKLDAKTSELQIELEKEKLKAESKDLKTREQSRKRIAELNEQLQEQKAQIAIINRKIGKQEDSGVGDDGWMAYLTGNKNNKTVEKKNVLSKPPTNSNGVKCEDSTDCDGFEYVCKEGWCTLAIDIKRGDIVHYEFSSNLPKVCASNDTKSMMIAEGIVRKVEPGGEGAVHIQWHFVRNTTPTDKQPGWKCAWSREDPTLEPAWITEFLGDEDTNPSSGYGLKSVMTFKEASQSLSIVEQKELESKIMYPSLLTQKGCYYGGPGNEDKIIKLTTDRESICRIQDEDARKALCKGNPDVVVADYVEILGKYKDPKLIPVCKYQPISGPGGQCDENGICQTGSYCKDGRCYEKCDDISKLPGNAFDLGCPSSDTVPRTGTYFCDYNACGPAANKHRQNIMCYCCDDTKTCAHIKSEDCKPNPKGVFPKAGAYCKFV